MKSALRFATEYARKGYYVFPCKTGGKTPLTKNGHKDATRDEKVISEWWQKYPGANIGINCERSGIVVIDLDCHPGKPNGIEIFKELYGWEPVPKTPQAQTGSGGIHLVFKAPPGITKRIKGEITEGIDIKFNGYIVGEPSKHPNGNLYRWIKGFSLLDCAPTELPAWLLEHILEPDYKPIKDTGVDISYPTSNAHQIVAHCGFMRHFAEDAEKLSEPDWYQGIGILTYTEQASKAIHDYSSNYPEYSSTQTQKKFEHWKRDGKGPPTCKTIQEKCGDNYCQACPWNGKIKSPIVLGYQSHSPRISSKPPAFPNVLSGVFQEFVITASKALQCPEDYIACSMLVLSSVLMGGGVKIQLKPEWYQYANLFVALVGTPAAKKSPALAACFVFLETFAQRLMDEYQREKSLYEWAMKEYEDEMKEWKGSRNGQQPTEPSKPRLKQLRTSDTTVEALCELLDNNPKGIGLVFDELTGLLRSMNQYKSHGGADRSHYLSMWNNAPITVNRKGKEPIYIPSPYLNIIGGIQPDALLEIRRNER